MASVLGVLGAVAAPAAPLTGLSWSDGSSYIEIAGSTLTVTRDAAVSGAILSKASADLSGILGDGLGLVMTIRVRAEDVTEPASSSGGVKFMLAYRDADDGEMHYSSAVIPAGTYGWRTITNRVSILTAPFNPVSGTTQICLGLQGCTGRAEFDLSSLTLDAEPTGVALTNQDWIVRYPDIAGVAPGTPPLRGFMLPASAVTEADMDDLAAWNVKLLRFQMRTEGHALGIQDADQDLDEYAAWIDSRLDNLEDVLRWAAKRGMRVAVDLHSPPGGKHSIDGVRTMNMFFEERFANAFVETWRRIARRCAPIVQTMGPVIYGYDLVNEPEHRMPVPFSYWELQRRAAEAIRRIDPDTPIIIEGNLSDNAESYRYLSPLAMDNVIYQVHIYKPFEFTHQGVGGNPLSDSSGPFSYPSASRGWNHELIRKVLAPVLAFQQRHQCRIYVGEFSAAAWAPGADFWLRDCIDIFEEYGWDWTYLAFRASGIFSIEHEPIEPGRAGDYNFLPSDDNPRRAAVLDTLLRAPDIPWFASGPDTNGEERVTGGLWDANHRTFTASQRRGGIARVESVVTPKGGFGADHLPRLLAEAVADGCAAAIACVADDDGDGPLSLYGLASEGGAPAWMRLEGFTPFPGEPFRVITELDATNGIHRVRYAAGDESSSLARLRSTTGDTWLPAPGAFPAQTADPPRQFDGRLAFSGDVSVSSLCGAAPEPGAQIAFGAVTGADAPAFTNAVVTLQVAHVGDQIRPGAVLRMSVFAGTPTNGVAQSSQRLLGIVERPLDGPGAYVFDTAGAIDPSAFDDLLSCRVVFSLVNADGTDALGAPLAEDSLSFNTGSAWFSASARAGKSRVRGGSWLSQPKVSGNAFVPDVFSEAAFQASAPRGGLVRVDATLVPEGGYDAGMIDLLLDEIGDCQAAVAVCEDSGGALFLCGLASSGGTPAWVPLEGAASALAANATLRIVAELDYTGETPLVSYLAGVLQEAAPSASTAGRSPQPLYRLRSRSGKAWLPACAPAEGAPGLSGGVAFSGNASLLSLVGTSAVKYHPPKPFTGTLFFIQ